MAIADRAESSAAARLRGGNRWAPAGKVEAKTPKVTSHKKPAPPELTDFGWVEVVLEERPNIFQPRQGPFAGRSLFLPWHHGLQPRAGVVARWAGQMHGLAASLGAYCAPSGPHHGPGACLLLLTVWLSFVWRGRWCAALHRFCTSAPLRLCPLLERKSVLPRACMAEPSLVSPRPRQESSHVRQL